MKCSFYKSCHNTELFADDLIFRALENISNSLQECRNILDRLFPSTDVAALQPLTREELVELVVNSSSPTLPDMTLHSSSITGHPGPAVKSDATLALEQLHGTPSEYDEESPDFVADDVNALSLSSTRQSSYVGSSSIATALKVIAVICPGVMKNQSLTAPNSPYNKSDRGASLQASVHVPHELEAAFVDAYFDHVHVLVPMVNEQQFRQRFESNTRDDVSWLALMNMVLAMGSIARETCLETSHIIFYQRAKSLLNFDSFGSGKVEIVQALAIMGGLYLHYCNRPNMAVAVTGAALRMAYALGLHRKQPSEVMEIQPPDQKSLSDRETKKRTWWSLVCLDTWGSTTLGRPSMGDCFGPAISVSPPSFEDFQDYPVEARAPALVAGVHFCELSAQIQDRLASSACLNLEEAAAYDMQLENQYLSLPPLLRSPNRCATNLLIPRAILKWRNQNARLLLHRPTLLAAALLRRSFDDLAFTEQESILRCRKLAGETIVDIACDWQPDPICGWHAVWHLFQASMVPLVSIFYEYNNAAECGKWHGLIEMVLRLLQSMELWSPAAKRTREVISELHISSIQLPKDIMAGSAPLWDTQAPFLFDESWTNSMWFNASDWPTFPLEPTEFGNGTHQMDYNNGMHQNIEYNGNGHQDYMNGNQHIGPLDDVFGGGVPSV